MTWLSDKMEYQYRVWQSVPHFLSDLWTTFKEDHPRISTSKIGKNLYNKDIVIRRADGLTKTDGDRLQKLRRDDKWPLGGSNFWPLGSNLNNLDKDLLDEATYQISKVWAFKFTHKKNFKVFLYMRLCKTSDPGWGYFRPQGYNLNSHGRSLTDDTTCQI